MENPIGRFSIGPNLQNDRVSSTSRFSIFHLFLFSIVFFHTSLFRRQNQVTYNYP